MYFVMLLAHPKPQHPEYGETDGAYASCWVDAHDAVVAESRARSLLDEVGWDTEEVEESYAVQRQQYESDPKTLSLYDQALQDGVVASLHSWPVGGDEEV